MKYYLTNMDLKIALNVFPKCIKVSVEVFPYRSIMDKQSWSFVFVALRSSIPHIYHLILYSFQK